eukprot:10985291-Ditylum_brightwellii.AAC.1
MNFCETIDCKTDSCKPMLLSKCGRSNSIRSRQGLFPSMVECAVLIQGRRFRHKSTLPPRETSSSPSHGDYQQTLSSVRPQLL